MRRSLFFIAIGSLLILVSFLVYSISTKMTAKQTAKEKLIRSPKLDLYDLDSARFELPGSALAMIFFDTECDFCQHEASEILNHRKMFVDKNIVMISAEPIVTIKKFARTSGLSELPSVRFAKIKPDQVYEKLGSLTVPHVFIYNHDHELIREFKGGVSVDTIANHLPVRK